MKVRTILISGAIFAFSMHRLYATGDRHTLLVAAVVLGLLLFFTGLGHFLDRRQSPLGEEITGRTAIWWWMTAVFILSLSTPYRVIPFLLMGFICFSALREFYSLMPMREAAGPKTLSFKDRISILISYLWIPVVVATAYLGGGTDYSRERMTRTYLVFTCLVPVYLTMVLPFVFVLQNRAEGTIKSLGILSFGVMLCVFLLGHSLLLINLAPFVLLYCFALTEARDLMAFWIGRSFAVICTGRAPHALKRILALRVAREISPKKTWATGICSAVATAALSVCFVPFMPDLRGGRLSPGFAALIGLSIGFVGLMGDLVFWMIKKDMGRRHFSDMLSVQGGILDRVDSLVFAAPVTFHLLYWKYF